MLDIQIGQVPAAAIIVNSNWDRVLKEYSEESAIKGMPPINPDYKSYLAAEHYGTMKIFGAFHEGQLIGILTMFVVTVPHYSTKIATIESIFILKEFRKDGAGIKLIKTAQEAAKFFGATGLFISAPIDGKLAKVLEKKKDFTETNRVFFQKLQ